MSSFRALARLRHASIKGLFSVQPSSTGCTITDVIGYTAAALLLYFAAEERRSIFTNVTKALLQYYRDATHIDDKRGNCNLHDFSIGWHSPQKNFPTRLLKQNCTLILIDILVASIRLPIISRVLSSKS